MGNRASYRCLVLGEEPLATACGEILLERGHTIAGLVTLNPQMAAWAEAHDVPVLARKSYGARMAEGDIDVLFSITHPAIIREEDFSRARVAAINFHDGPLPRYAGINGSAWALLRGESKHAIVWHRIAAGIDTGEIVERRDVEIEPRETSLSFNIKNATLALEAFGAIVEKLEEGRLTSSPQPAGERLVFSRHDRPVSLAVLDFAESAAALDRFVRACDWGPYVNRFGLAKIVHRDRALLVREAEPLPAATAQAQAPAAGTVLEAGGARMVIACGGGGALAVTRFTHLDGAAIDVDAAARYLGVKAGDRLVDDDRAARDALTRSVAENELFFARRLTKLDPPVLPFASTPTAPSPAADGAVHVVPLEIGALAQRFPDDVEAAATAAFAFALATLCDRDDMQLALATAGHHARCAGAHAVLAPSVPCFVAVDAERGFAALLAAVRAELDELDRRGAHLADLAPRTPGASQWRLNAAVVGGEATAIPPGAVVALRIARARVELVLDAAAVDAGAGRVLAAQIAAVCAQVARDPQRPLARVDLLDDAQRERQVRGFNDTARPYRDDILIHSLFEEQADARPDDAALECDGRRITYREVEERANRLAHALRARGAKPGDLVAFRLERGFDLVITMIGIAKSGAAYVPIDPAYPADRAAFMIEDARAALVVDEAFLASDAVKSASSARPAHAAEPGDVCYVIYTSGSTGKPKGVVLTHRAVVNTLEWVNREMAVDKSDKLLFVTSPSFDLSVYDVFGALGAGALVEIATSETLREPALLVQKIVQPGITIWDSAPPALARLVSFFPEKAPASTLRLAMMSGDWIPVKLPDNLASVFPGVKCLSLGGATEAAIWSNFHRIERVDPAWRSIPYGRPIQNARYYILDRRMRPAPVGVPGDLYIGGACLAQGYLNRAELTADRFLPDPFLGGGERIYKTGDLARFWEDGTMEFLGRADFQVKVRGFRVELGEIEAVLRKQPGVRDAVCIARADASGEKAIYAYVVPQKIGTSDADPPAMKAAVAATLPDFMVPSAIVRLDRLPVTSNGKLDRNALPDPSVAAEKRARVEPRTDLERSLARIWSDVLKRPVGIEDHFFDDLGGHSLMAVMLVTRLKKDMGKEVPLSLILSKPTIAGVAAALDGGHGGNGAGVKASHLVALTPQRSDARAPLVFVAGIGGQVFTYRPLAERLGPAQPLYGLTAVGVENGEAPKESIEEIAALYAEELAEEKLRGSLVIGGFSVGAVAAFELATLLVARGLPVQGLVLFDALAPGYPEPLPSWERGLEHVKEFWKRKGAERRRYVGERARNAFNRVMFKAGFGHLVAPTIHGADETLDDRMRHLWARMSFARGSYLPHRRFSGPLLLFKTAEGFQWPATRMDDPCHGWGRWVSGPIEVVTLTGNHESVFEPDNVERMVRGISAFVDGLPAAAPPLVEVRA